MKKVLSYILIMSLILTLSIEVFAENNKTKNNQIYIESLKNVENISTKGRLLRTEVIEENGMKKIKKGIAVKSNITIKDSKLKGVIELSSTKYQLKGELDTELGKYNGQVLNKDDYLFEAYVLDEQGNILVNIFDKNGKPKSFLIDGSEPEYIDMPFEISSTEYDEELAEESTSGLYFKVTGPKTPNGAALDSIIVRTKSDDAWQNSGLNDYNWKVNCYVSDLDISFIPQDDWTKYSREYPVDDSDTSFEFPMYFGSIIGFQILSIKTSSTDVDVNTDGSIDIGYFWSPLVGYTDEYDTDIEDSNKNFGAQVEQFFNGTGSVKNKVTVDITYGCIAKQSEFSQPVTAYPSFYGYDYYYRTVE